MRAANNGISGAIDSRGRVIDAFALNVRGEMDVSLNIPTPSSPLLGDPRINGCSCPGAAGTNRSRS